MKLRQILPLIIGALLLLALGIYIGVRMQKPRPQEPAPPAAEAQLPAGVSFIDRFEHLDTARWSASERGANGAWMLNDWRGAQIAPGPEGLVFTMAPNPPGSESPYASGELYSNQDFLYGYFETRMRVPRGSGVVTGVFTYVLPDGANAAQEIDIEILGRDTRTIALTYHIGGRGIQKLIPLPFDAAEDFHTYAFEWTPDALRWYVDNDMVHEVKGDRVARLNRRQLFLIDLWATEELYRWAGHLDASRAPWKLTIACVAHADRYPGHVLCT